LEFFIDISFRPRYGPGADSACNRNEYQEYFLEGKCGRCVVLTTLPHSCADCLEIWEPQAPGTLRVCLGLLWDCFCFIKKVNCVSANHRNNITANYTTLMPASFTVRSFRYCYLSSAKQSVTCFKEE